MTGNGVEYQYAIEIYKKGDPGAHLGTEAVLPDFGPIQEGAVFEAIRKDRDRPVVLDPEECQVEPRWDKSLGLPYLSGLKAVVARENRPTVTYDIPLGYFDAAARAVSSPLVEAGKLIVGETFEYRVRAHPRHAEAAVTRALEPRPLFSVKRGQVPLAVDEQSFAEFAVAATPCGVEDDDQMPALIPQTVLDEVFELRRQAEAAETGGILIGNLHRDGDCGELFLEVTAQIAARHAEQELTRLTFTPRTWAAVDAAISLRGKKEMYVGWWHTHPSGHWCDQCPAETRAKCTIAGKLSGDFFSSQDAALHRTVFPQGFCVALVISDHCDKPHVPLCRLYGWRHGMVRPRGFHILGADAVPATPADRCSQKGINHVRSL
ncbi:MAG TPA: hypothetical protein DD670_06355 [Planctomycetaceae bacterium]|nr:hypothetical protein [Planctomycetaceae bacterium]